MKKALISALILTTSISALADDNGSPYSFGGACASQGVWTANALSSTQNLRKVTLQLKDDPNCRALGNSMQTALAELESQVKDLNSSSGRATRLSQIPAELSALRTFFQSAPEMRAQVMKLMMDRSIEGAKMSAEVGAAAASSPLSQMLGDRMVDFGERINRGTKSGVQILNRVVDTIPQLDQCLTEDGPQAIGNFLASTIQVATAFAGSGQDSTGSQMAQLVSKLTTVVRDRKYSKVLRKLNQQEFLASMSCLMEVTSESYCQARDAMSLFKKGMEDINWKNARDGKPKPGNPFLGYYVLNTHVPNITKWMQKIQIGVDPKLPTDAIFQNKIQQEVVDFYKNYKTLLGAYSEKLITIRGLKTLEAKQNEVLKLVVSINDNMIGGFRQEGQTNFFTMNKTPLKIPFFLIGMGDEVPAQVQGNAQGLMKIPYDEWMQANINNRAVLPMFQDPDALAEMIGRNMQELAQQANISVIEYFSRWFIVDKQALVTEAVTDINYTVKDSLHVIRDYLDVVRDRVTKGGGDGIVVSTAMDLQNRIDNVMASFDRSDAIGKRFAANLAKVQQDKSEGRSNLKFMNEKDWEEAAAASTELVNTVFEQFNVMQSRSGFIANRMVTIVNQDYIQLIKSNDSFTEYQKDIFIQTGMAALDRMLQLYNGNPANIQSDLNMALRINKGNIEALQDLMKDNMVAAISNLRVTSNGGGGRWSVISDSVNRLRRDAFADKYTRINGWNLAPDLFSPAASITLWAYYLAHTERYPLSGNGAYSPQSEYNDSGYLRAQLCIQALAFWDQSALTGICEGAVLNSPFPTVKGYSTSYDEKMVSHMKDKVDPQMRASLNHSERICAFRDFNRRNMVLFMSVNKK